MFVSERGSDATDDIVQFSSGHIGIEDGRLVLMYGLTMRSDGECRFRYSVNGMVDIRERNCKVQDGKLFDSEGRQIESKPNVFTTSPGSSIWLSGRDTVSLRISYDHKALNESEVRDRDVHISTENLQGVPEWLSQPQERRGSRQAQDKCSLEKRRIF